MVGAAEWGEGTGLGGPRDRAPKEQLDRNTGLSAADQVSSRSGEGFLCVAFLLFLQLCAQRRVGTADSRAGVAAGGLMGCEER